MTSKRVKFLLTGILFLAVILRLSTFFYDYVNIDETDYTLAARTLLNGGLPYRDFMIYQPPLIYYAYALGFWLSGGVNLWAVHIITILFVLGTVSSLYFLVRDVTKSYVGGLAAALAYALYSTTFIPQDMLAANCEILMIFPLTFSVWLLHRALQRDNFLLFFLSGVAISFGVLAKYQGGIVWGAAMIYLIMLHPFITKEKFLGRFWQALMLTIGFIAPLAAYALYLYYKGVLSYAYEAFSYILLYAKGPAQSDGLYVVMKFLLRAVIFSLSSLPIWIASFYVIYKYLFQLVCHPRESGDPWHINHPDSRLRRRDMLFTQPFIAFIILWFFLSIIPIIMGGRIYFHYFLIILPTACALAGIYCSSFKLSKLAKVLVVAWMIICAIGWNAFSYSKALKPLGAKETWVGAADYLKEIAKPGDTLFVWGLCYQLYFYSGMDLGSRFTSADYLTGRSPMTSGLEFSPGTPNPPSSLKKLYNDFAKDAAKEFVIFDTSANIFPKSWDYFRQDMQKALPTYIVDTTESNYRRYKRYPIKNYPYLENIISKHYEKIKELNGYIIYQTKGDVPPFLTR